MLGTGSMLVFGLVVQSVGGFIYFILPALNVASIPELIRLPAIKNVLAGQGFINVFYLFRYLF